LPVQPGTRLGHYEIVSALGAGGMGVVYRAIDERLNRTVAIKVISADMVADPSRKQRFIREARAASALSHPNIVTIHDVDEVEGLDYLVMELVSGQTLDRVIPHDGLPIARALEWAEQIASALDAAHAAGIVHRDIKPANIMIGESGQVKVLDFGLAKRLDRVLADGATTAAVSFASESGPVGTFAYMSPEQAQGLPIDGRTDIFSFGAMLHEMLTGRPAFAGTSGVGILTAILRDNPAPVETLRKDVTGDLGRLVQACLSKDRAHRPSARDVLDRLAELRRSRAATAADLSQTLRRRVVVVPALAILLVSVGAGTWWWKATARERWARNVALPEIQRLVDLDDNQNGYQLAREAIAVLPDDPQLKQLWVHLTFLGRIDTVPQGADVEIKGYLADEAGPWIPLGQTPLNNVRLPMGQLRVRISKAGFAPIEAGTGFFFTYTLDRPDAVPPGMVRVGRATTRVGTVSASVNDFWIDKLEVTNRQYKEFVDKGGYRSPEYWTVPFADAGRTLSWEDAMTAFRDRTSRAGPATWEFGTYPDGAADLPVSGVSWYEAAAFAAFAGKKIPTAFHWRAAAGLYPPTENFVDHLLLSNFDGKGPAAVGSHKGLGPFGTFDLAGNVKEWCWNETGRGRLILGGAWTETRYMFMDLDAQSPMQRSATYGIRLMKEIEPSAAETAAPIMFLTRDLAKERPVDDPAFEILRRLYGYDDLPLDSAVDQRDDAAAWRKETVSYAAAYGNERITAYLYLPKNVSPPYQAMLYFPGGDAQYLQTSRDLQLRMVDFVIRSGRALLFPIYKGTYERAVAPSGPNTARDVTIARVKDATRSIDYLVSRSDIDAERLGFYGLSLGATPGIILSAMEPRLKATIITGGGMTRSPGPPEIDLLNYAPRVRVPTLMVNGRADFAFPYETSQLPLFRMLGLPADRKAHATFEGGHIPLEIHQVMGRMLEWLDQYLGPVSNVSTR
jgi:eukaryotic-like serine/threonine-protein kinase